MNPLPKLDLDHLDLRKIILEEPERSFSYWNSTPNKRRYINLIENLEISKRVLEYSIHDLKRAGII